MISDANYKMQLGDQAPDFKLKGTDNQMHELKSFRAPLLLIVFTCNHCPYAQAYEARIMNLAKRQNSKVDVVAINSNDAENYAEDSFEKMKLKRYPVYLYDESQKIARDYGAECTPHFFLFDEARKLRYQGRFDDNKTESMVTKHELENAIKALQIGERPNPHTTNAFGCSIKWKQESYGAE